MKIEKKLLENFIVEVYLQEKDNILKEIKLEKSKKDLLFFVSPPDSPVIFFNKI